MKHMMHYFGSALVAGTLVVGLTVASEKSGSQKPDPKMEEMMKKVEAAGTPGAAHKALEPLVGNWNAEVKMFMDPSAPPNVTRATAKNSWAMKGRFVQQEFKGEFMGKPFQGLGFTGYDNVKQAYNSIWLDDMSTGIFIAEGKGDSAGKVITFEGTHSCPETGEKEKQAKQVFRIINRDKHVFEMHDPSKGANSKTMEITYTRK